MLEAAKNDQDMPFNLSRPLDIVQVQTSKSSVLEHNENQIHAHATQCTQV
jgi:hypothetical protein